MTKETKKWWNDDSKYYHEKIRNTKFSVSNYLLRCCSKYIKLSKEDFDNVSLKR